MAELPEALSFIFDLPKYPSDLLVWKKSSAEEVKKVLPELSEVLNKISVQAWTKEKLEQKVGSGLKKTTTPTGRCFGLCASLFPDKTNLPGRLKLWKRWEKKKA